MTLFRAPFVLTRIATALERIADAMGQMLRDADGHFDEERVSRAVDDRLPKHGQRRALQEASARETYERAGVPTDADIRDQLGLPTMGNAS